MKVAIIDYGMGNLRSVLKAVERTGGIPLITRNQLEIEESDKIILPGVGHFRKGMENLKELGLIEILKNEVMVNKKAIMGICLGMQLMMEHSEEGDVEGLSWFKGDVIRFNVSDKYKYKVPHMGWNTLNYKKKVVETNLNNEYYFVHSYHVIADNEIDILTTTVYDYEFVSSIEKDNIIGYQFHPEKSHLPGLQLISNFINSVNV
ncbi:MAG TPA: imidazole glycerol phosphate synthase subunit HisH [Bacteroidetes bacterium]|nr:imidazole glycerol phosphate synthase subunit HisH [Bacteroidota bacterium]